MLLSLAVSMLARYLGSYLPSTQVPLSWRRLLGNSAHVLYYALGLDANNSKKKYTLTLSSRHHRMSLQRMSRWPPTSYRQEGA